MDEQQSHSAIFSTISWREKVSCQWDDN